MVLSLLNIKGADVLVVDDDERNRRLLCKRLEVDGYSCRQAANGRDALQAVAALPPDLILLDIMMPEMDGFEVVTRLKQEEGSRTIPVIMITALEDKASVIRALSSGAEEYLTKPIDATELHVRVRNMLRLKRSADHLRNHNEHLEAEVSKRTADLQRSFMATLDSLGRAADFRDDETGAHVRRISYYSRELARELEMDDDYCDHIFHASPLHDIGKIGTPDAVLFKPGPLNEQEWRVMKQHTTAGWGILTGLNSPYTDMGCEIALCHHERWDGGGYPSGLAGAAIPLAARIMQICDVYDALRSKRPYKPAFSHDKATRIIVDGDGRTDPSHFDPAVLAAFRVCADRFDAIFAAHSKSHAE